MPWCCPSEENSLGNVQFKDFSPLVSVTDYMLADSEDKKKLSWWAGLWWVPLGGGIFPADTDRTRTRWILGPTSSSSWGASSSFSVLSRVKGGLEILKNWKLIFKWCFKTITFNWINLFIARMCLMYFHRFMGLCQQCKLGEILLQLC